MKINKILIIALAIVLIVGIIAGVVYFTTRNDDADKDPTDEFIENNNYPFNGIYGDDVSIVTEEQIKQALEEDATITEYAKDITVEISKDQIVNLSCSLENAENLCSDVPELETFRPFASAMNGQRIGIGVSVNKGDNGYLEIEPASVTIGKTKVNLKLFSGLFGKIDMTQWVGDIPNDAITFTEGAIAFSDELPKFLQ